MLSNCHNLDLSSSEPTQQSTKNPTFEILHIHSVTPSHHPLDGPDSCDICGQCKILRQRVLKAKEKQSGTGPDSSLQQE